MKIKFIKTNIIGGSVDDVVNTFQELKEKSKWLEGNVYSNNMLVFVKEKNAIYKVKIKEEL